MRTIDQPLRNVKLTERRAPKLRPTHARTRRCPLSPCRVHPSRAPQRFDQLGRCALYQPAFARQIAPHLAAPGVSLPPKHASCSTWSKSTISVLGWPVPEPQDRRPPTKSVHSNDSAMPRAHASNRCSHMTSRVSNNSKVIVTRY